MVNLNANREKWRSAAELHLRVLLKDAESNGVEIAHGNLNLPRGGHLRYFSASAAAGQNCTMRQGGESSATGFDANSGSLCKNKHMAPFSTTERVAVLLPGWAGGIGMYACALPYLVRDFDVVYCIDLPGMGLSRRDPFSGMGAAISQSTRFFSTRLEAGIAALHRRDVRFAQARHRVLGANSFGGNIAVE